MAKKKEQNQEQQQKEKRKPGRPFGTLKYDNLEDLEDGINKYFDDCDRLGKPYTMTGLALALNITPQSLCNYGTKEYAEGKYFETVNRARMRCLDYAESRLYDKEGSNGAKFTLTNNAERMGGLKYADRQEVSVDSAPITFVDNLTD